MHSYLEACVLVEKQENYFLITHSYLETRFKFQAKQLLIILQNLPDGILQSDTPKAIDRAHPVRFFFFFKKNMHVTTR